LARSLSGVVGRGRQPKARAGFRGFGSIGNRVARRYDPRNFLRRKAHQRQGHCCGADSDRCRV